MVDADEEGYLLQILQTSTRQTYLFFLYSKNGSQRLCAGNFKALFESIEREQALRGTL
jgi:4-hydroxyphenylpyruvate dioxygenase